ncbi:MAG: site-specific DNA-methyltransferase, partial [Gammaproteobacteria bacterium]|nr:site-specific DNA-methyltransferase [Gammaproteobacteria bacterium]
YNVGKAYDDDLSEAEYFQLLNSVWKEVHRVLVPGGRACVNIANLGRKPYIPLNAKISDQMTENGFLMRGEIIWDKSASAGTSCAWGSWKSASNPVLRDTHEYILVFSKGKYNREAKDKTSTISREEFLDFTKSIWTFPAESAKRVNHPAPFPVELPRRLIQLYTFANEIVLDPFMGSGTTAVASIQSDRSYVGYDTSLEYVQTAQSRVAAL